MRRAWGLRCRSAGFRADRADMGTLAGATRNRQDHPPVEAVASFDDTHSLNSISRHESVALA